MTYQPFYRKSIASILMVAFVGMLSPISAVHAVAVISEVTPVGSPTSNPTYVFNSDSSGSIAYGGPCTSGFSSAVVGPNTIVFNTGSEGTFSLCTVSVDDGLGGGMSNILTLTDFFIDTSAPSISILGPGIVNLLINQSYTDLGASWTDNDPGNGSGPAILTMTGITAIGPVGPTSSGAINTSYTGTYSYMYNITDGAGNIAIQRKRTVNVTTGAIPVLTLVGTTPIIIASGSVYNEDGATANDVEDGDISGLVTISGSVDTGNVGTYIITYRVVDSNGNNATPITRSVDVVSGSNPVITMRGVTPILHELGIPYSDSGATAVDLEDGDITLSMTSSGTVDSNTSGTYYIDYNVVDSGLNAATTVTRTIIVADRTAPGISLVGSGTINIPLNNIYIDAGGNWTDLIDGSGAIFASGTVNTGALGSYTLSYHHTDAAGNIGIPVSRTVNVTTGSLPVITLSGSNPLTLFIGDVYTESGFTISDLEDGDITASGSATGSVNTNIPGAYIITYSVIDSNMNTVTATRTVNVTAGSLPVITLSGSNPVNLLLGDTYTESGFTISDLEDGDITASGSATGSVNTSIPGIYILSYSVTDSNMNTVTVTRNVNVLDIISPVVTLIGSGNVSINAGQSYTELGASWTDNVDGSGSAIVSGVVNTNLAGLYVLSYNYTDTAGNTGTLVRRNVTVVGSISLPISGGGGGMGTSYGTPAQPDFNSAPTSSNTVNMESENLLIPSISRLLRNTTIPHDNQVVDNNSTSDSSTSSQVVTRTIADPITDYICPVVSELQNLDNDQIANISEGEFTEDVRALLMYRGLDNSDLATNYTERYFINRGYGIVKSNEAFEGDRAITRAEFVKMLVRALSCHYTLTDSTLEFSDVGPNAWYSEYINFATNKGWISGYDNGKFAPHGLMTRGEIAKVLAKAIQLNTDNIEASNTIDTTMNSASDNESFNLDDLFGDSTEETTSTIDTTMDTTNSSDLFIDVPMSNSFAPYIYALRDQGILNGKTKSLYGINNNISRNEVARIFHKIFIKVNN